MNPVRIAAAVGFLAVALGAFGAHGLKDMLSRNGTLEFWHTAALYHLVHAVVLLVVATRAKGPNAVSAGPAFWLILGGIALFSGSLYTYALTCHKEFAALTPVGGVSLLLGWLWLAVKG